jgi:hypothetical protein
LFPVSLCLSLKAALLFLLLLFIRNASKGGKPNRKPYYHYGFRNPYKRINQ